jgi:hypothetical protein
MEHSETSRPEHPAVRPRISWAAILAGAACIWIFKLVLLLLAGIGGESTSVGTEEWGSKLWLVALVSTCAVWLIGWLVARLGKIHVARIGAMHGFMAWCLAFAVGMILAQSGQEQLAGSPEALLNVGYPPVGMGGTLEEGERGGPAGGLGDHTVRWGFALLGMQIAAAIWGGWAGTSSLRRGSQRPLEKA